MTRLETERLVIRPFKVTDFDEHYAAVFSDPMVMRYLPGGKPIPEEQARSAISRFMESWETKGYGLAAVFRKDDNRLIGHCGLQNLDGTYDTEIAYALAPHCWGMGYATEAAKASRDFGFNGLNLDRIVAIAAHENAPSRRVIEKLGMTYERDDRFFDLDVAFYGLDRPSR